MNTAAFVVDAQKGFTPLCPDELPIINGDTIVPSLLEMINHCDVLVGSKDAHPDNAIWIASDEQPMLTPLDFENADLAWNRHCVVGTMGFELLDGLPQPMDFDYFVWKGIERDLHPYGACYHDLAEKRTTGVIEYLLSKDCDTVVVGGLAYDHCVGTTAIQLAKTGLFKVYVYRPATKGISDVTMISKTDEMERYGIMIIDDLNDLN